MPALVYRAGFPSTAGSFGRAIKAEVEIKDGQRRPLLAQAPNLTVLQLHYGDGAAVLMMNTFEVAESEPIPVDTHADESDRESAYGGSDASVYTESLRSSLLESLKENGRGYHKCLHLVIPRNAAILSMLLTVP